MGEEGREERTGERGREGGGGERNSAHQRTLAKANTATKVPASQSY